jgi:hypothetical protein
MGSVHYDVLIAGGTPAGIMAAIAAGRMGSKVVLAEYHAHLGGMSASGLGKSDIENRNAIAGLFHEFTRRVYSYYINTYGEGSENAELCKEGYYYEPSVAEKIFNGMISETKNISVFTNHQIEEVKSVNGRIEGAYFKDRSSGQKRYFTAGFFIDATYEGDLYALAGAGFRTGREGREEFNEEHAGRIFFDYNEKVFLDGSTGEADDKVPAYTYRLCLTDDPANGYRLKEPPSGYDRTDYLKYIEDLQAGRMGPPKVLKEGHGFYPDHFNTILRVFSFTRIPNNKFDVNINPRLPGFPFGAENYAYPEGGWKERENIIRRHRELALGLLYFIQNDPGVPEEHRKMARCYLLPADEFTDNNHFPWQLYVREARRLEGLYMLSENDVVPLIDGKRTRIFHDSIISGEFPIDSFPVSKEPSKDNKVLEGYISMLEISPYQVPYRIMVSGNFSNMLVPVAASTTHVAFSTIRMEPMWMGIGQAAGTAAALAIKNGCSAGELDVTVLQRCLIDNKQILTYFDDVDENDKAFAAVQFFGTRGFFDSYDARTKDPLFWDELEKWMKIFAGMNGRRAFDGGGTVSPEKEITIAGFTEMLHQHGLMAEHAAQPSAVAAEWLYHPREVSFTMLRGEACMAFYYLFFKAEKQDNS